jgi:hypothetical protein
MVKKIRPRDRQSLTGGIRINAIIIHVAAVQERKLSALALEESEIWVLGRTCTGTRSLNPLHIIYVPGILEIVTCITKAR